jgi:hypothetical protein
MENIDVKKLLTINSQVVQNLVQYPVMLGHTTYPEMALAIKQLSLYIYIYTLHAQHTPLSGQQNDSE